MRIVFAGVLLLITQISIAQKGSEVQLSNLERVEDEQFKKSMAIVPVYKYTSSSIEPYIMFGVDPPENLQDLQIKKMPNMQGMTDTGYSFIYFSGADNAANQGYILTILGNYRRSMRTIYFFTDKNNNLDFSDDGPADSLKYRDFEMVISIPNPIVPEAYYQVKLSRLEYGDNVMYKNLLTEHYKKHSGKKTFTDINYCFREQRYNVLAADYIQGEDSFRFAVKDLNTNGLFNEPCIDKVFIGPYGNQVTTEEMQFILPNVQKTRFEWNRKVYYLKDISASGGQIKLSVSAEEKTNYQLPKGKKIPAFSYKPTHGKKKISIRSYKGKDVYLYFWDKDKLSSEDTLYLGKLMREYASELNLVTLNHGDAPKSVYLVQHYDKLSFPIGFSSTKIGKAYFIQETPDGFLADSKQKLIQDRMSPKQVYERYSSKDIKKGT